MEVAQGWLIPYHGLRTTVSGSIYRLGLALLDRQDPTRLLRWTDEWVFGPKMCYERDGDVDDVVFPCGWTVRDDTVCMYYGAADSRIALATVSLSDLVDSILRYPEQNTTG